jgi:light-regulated signal transduction histidine kinase (bacteriophytochrome)
MPEGTGPSRRAGRVLARATHLVGIIHDITRLKEADAALRATNCLLAREVHDKREALARLDAADRELEAFSDSVSHDLRAPLRAVDGFSQALLEDYGDTLDEGAKQHLGRVRAATERMRGLIDDLLELSRLGRRELRVECVDLGALAREIGEQLRRADPARSVELVIGPAAPVTGDPGLLRIALENLLGNAWKFTSKQERARIELGETTIAGDRVLFVRDDGAGFEMAHAEKLFRPFARLHSDSEFPGTGIGLATVQRIVHRHGGTIWAEAAPGRGATFYFTILTSPKAVDDPAR